MSENDYNPDILEGYESKSINLKSDYEGEVVATIIRSCGNTGNGNCVLYLHGYVDYFLQGHLGRKFNENGYDFYAIDLRKYGRSLLSHQHPNYSRDLGEYFEEITIAIREINEQNKNKIYLLGHSTGGLIFSTYMNSGPAKNLISGLMLNSPFFDFNQTKIEKAIAYRAAQIMASMLPYSYVNGALSPIYPKSLHKDFEGEWDFNLAWKPIKGFSTYFKWVLAIRQAQKSLTSSNIQVPTLVMHSSGTAKGKKFSEEVMNNDIVLDVEDIKRVGAKLGPKVKVLEVENAVHDIFLSRKPVRENAFQEMFSWLEDL